MTPFVYNIAYTTELTEYTSLHATQRDVVDKC